MDSLFGSGRLRLLLLLPAIYLSGCCLVTSADCGCVPPNPELDATTLKWIAPYDNRDFFVFQDSLGNTDSLQVSRSKGTEYCGGEECGSDCKFETRVLVSLNNPDIQFAVTAALNREVRINNLESKSKFIYVGVDAPAERTFPESQSVTALITDDFEWKNQKTKVLKIKCENGPDCSNYAMKEMIVSMDFGLLEYLQKDGVRWKKND
jgi:hypothetical protein